VIWKIILFFCCLVNFQGNVYSATNSAKTIAATAVVPEATNILINKAKTSTPVLMGVYPVKLYDFDLPRRTFKVSFYTWWRTLDKDYQPHKSVEITNATDYLTKFGAQGKNNDEYFTYVRYYATIQYDWNVKDFPFDHQFLEVHLEDFADIQYIIFKPDGEHSHIHPELTLEGWNILGMQLKQSTTTYDTNFGDVSTPKGQYSRLTFVLEIKRQGWRAYFNYFIGFFIAFFLCNMIYLVDPQNLNARASLSLGAIVTSVGNKYVLDQFLPFTTQFTLSDTIQITTFIMITIAVFSFIILDILAKRDKVYFVYWVNRGLGLLSLAIYLMVVGTHTYYAVIS
jgi:hypothetical protein